MARLNLEEPLPGHWRLSGVMSMFTISDYYKKFDRLRPRAKGSWVIDCRDVAQIDTAGIAYLLSCIRHAKRYRLGLKFDHMPAEVFDLMHAQGVKSLFEPYLVS